MPAVTPTVIAPWPRRAQLVIFVYETGLVAVGGYFQRSTPPQ
ncbi:hypothetical protein ACNAW0_28940 [Micromonospora sp. SL1-18]